MARCEHTPAEELGHRLAAELVARRAAAAPDPFANPILAFARDLAGRLSADEIGLGELSDAVNQLTADAFMGRAERLGAYLGDPDPDKDAAAVEAVLERLADDGFEAYAAALARPPFGVVLTGHPTFALNRELSVALVELATGRDRADQPLDQAGRTARRRLACTLPHRPPDPLTIDVEHAWSMEALENAATALEAARGAAIGIAKRRWPERWRELSPQLATLATWVGFDTDGRTDVTWLVSLEKRLDLKRRALLRCRRALAGATGRSVRDALALLDLAAGAVADQLTLCAAAKEDARETPALARALVSGRELALVDPAPLVRLVDKAVEEAEDETAARLLVLRGTLAAQGLSLAQVHVRLNAGQLHSAIRPEIDIGAGPSDPANRRATFAAADALLAKVQPQSINLGSLVEEPAPAKRLVMSIAQMAKDVDAANPVRFLIAEAESGFTLLVALYYARLFGVDDRVEISPLFETEAGFARGEALFEEALRSRWYRAHLQRQKRLAVEFGYSDSGRFIGQMAATFRAERLKLRLAELLEEQKLTDVELVLFDTHGESIGRGAHPVTLADRLDYLAPPRNRAEFAARGVAVKEETSFQGGEGYLPFLTPAAARASVRDILAFAYGASPEAEGDPIYAAPEFVSDFFATIQQAFSDLVEDPDYAALLGLFETRLLFRTGSRPEQRQRDGLASPRTLRAVGELRAIPNNGILQQLGYLANTVYGVGRAAEKDRVTFKAMLEGSPRFRRALQMASVAFGMSDRRVIQAYAALVDPALWLACRAGATGEAARAFDALEALAEKSRLHEPLERVLREIHAEDLKLQETVTPTDPKRRERLLLLHAIRLAALQRIARLAGEIPPFNPVQGVAREALQERLVRLDIPGAVEALQAIFPLHQPEPLAGADWGEPAGYRPDNALGYAVEHATLFAPLLALHRLALDITAAITHEIGACG